MGVDGSGRLIAKRYLAGGIDPTSHGYEDTTPVVGQTTTYDRSSNKMYERALQAESRSSLYEPFSDTGQPEGGYDSADRLRQYQRGVLASTGGYLNQGGGSITAPISLPGTDSFRGYDLDGVGNWKHSDYTPVGGEATEDLRQHNKLNEITSRKIDGDDKVKFTYDGTPGSSNGNLADDGTLLYSYDALNRLIEVKRKSDDAVIGQYVYDALNRRVSKTISNGGLSGDIPNGTTVYLYQDWQVIEERNDSDATTKQYVWGEYIDELLQMKTAVASGGGNLPAGDYYPLQDLLYRTTALTDSTGAIVEAYDTDAYGNTLIYKSAGTGGDWWADDAMQTDNPACEVIYVGYRYDPETKLYHVRHRTYNPVLGRWVQRDPLGYVDGMNLYQYAHNRPSVVSDGSGLASLSDFFRFTKTVTSGPNGPGVMVQMMINLGLAELDLEATISMSVHATHLTFVQCKNHLAGMSLPKPTWYGHLTPPSIGIGITAGNKQLNSSLTVGIGTGSYHGSWWYLLYQTIDASVTFGLNGEIYKWNNKCHTCFVAEISTSSTFQPKVYPTRILAAGTAIEFLPHIAGMMAKAVGGVVSTVISTAMRALAG